jgi:hypothetical protein
VNWGELFPLKPHHHHNSWTAEELTGVELAGPVIIETSTESINPNRNS